MLKFLSFLICLPFGCILFFLFSAFGTILWLIYLIACMIDWVVRLFTKCEYRWSALSEFEEFIFVVFGFAAICLIIPFNFVGSIDEPK